MKVQLCQNFSVKWFPIKFNVLSFWCTISSLIPGYLLLTSSSRSHMRLTLSLTTLWLMLVLKAHYTPFIRFSHFPTHQHLLTTRTVYYILFFPPGWFITPNLIYYIFWFYPTFTYIYHELSHIYLSCHPKVDCQLFQGNYYIDHLCKHSIRCKEKKKQQQNNSHLVKTPKFLRNICTTFLYFGRHFKNVSMVFIGCGFNHIN